MGNQPNKILKVLFTIEFILILVIITLALIDNKKIPTAYVVKEIPSIEESKFKLLTKAVCEENLSHIFCHDELFIKCNGKEYVITKDDLENFTKCNNAKLNLSDAKVDGNVTFRRR